MILNRIKLENFISHKSTEINFDYGINVIVGPNGAGKTSILEGISFSLFNIHNRGKKENLINARTKKSKISLDFEESGMEYSIEWQIERKKAAHGYLFRIKDGNKMLLARGGERVITSEVEKILGFDKDIFLQSIYIQQGEIEKLVDAQPSKRKELISKLLGIEDLERAWKNMKELIDAYEKRKAELEGELKKMPELEEEIKRVEEEFNAAGVSFKEKERKLRDVEDKIEILQAVLDKLNEDKKKFEELESRRRLVEKDVEFIDNKLKEKEEELSKAKEAYERIKKIEKEVRKFPYMEKYVEVILKKKSKEVEKERLEEKLYHIDKIEGILRENEKKSRLYNEKSELLKVKREERANYEGAEVALKRALKHLEERKKEWRRKKEEIEKEIERSSMILEKSVDIETIEDVLREKREEIERIKRGLENTIREIGEKIGASEGRIKEIEYNLSKISEISGEAVCPVCGRELTEEHVKKLKEEFTDEKRRMEAEIEKLKREQEESIEKKRRSEAKAQELASIDVARLKRLKEEGEEIKRRVKEGEHEIEEIKERVKKLRGIDQEIKKLETELEELKEAYQSYESARRELERYPPREEIEGELEPVVKVIEKLSLLVEQLVKKIGYVPRNPEEELKKLRRKKEEYDRNKPIADKKVEIERDISELRGKLMNKRIELSSIMEKVRKLGYDEEVHKQKEEEIERERKLKTDIEKEMVEIETKMKALKDRLYELNEEKKRLLEVEKERGDISRFIKILNEIREAFGKDGVQRVIRKKAKPMIESFTREFFEKFNLGYTDIEIDDDYKIRVTDANGSSEDIEQISGGEKVSLAIALRLAIARVLSGKIETIIMDEPTTHLDEERRKELINILNSFFREGGRVVPQMIIITHHREIEDIGDVIYEVNKKEGYSVAKVAEKPSF
ncbi:MAG: AAA family ATPase [Candidatus Methanospirareceae archaeon]